jgi:hypothetical protein
MLKKALSMDLENTAVDMTSFSNNLHETVFNVSHGINEDLVRQPRNRNNKAMHRGTFNETCITAGCQAR